MPGDGGVPATDAAARLAALAEEGRLRRAEALEAEAAEERRLAARERREGRRLGRAYVRGALLESPRGPALPLFRVAVAMVVAGTVLLFIPTSGSDRRGPWEWAGMALILGAIGFFFGARWLLGPRRARAEAAWLAGLPFPVRGYFDVLGSAPAEERWVRVRLGFRGEAPDRELLEGLLGRVHQPATARLAEGRRGRWTVESGTIRTPPVDDVEPTNVQVLWWMRGVVEEVLLPLHEVYPLRGAEFGE